MEQFLSMKNKIIQHSNFFLITAFLLAFCILAPLSAKSKKKAKDNIFEQAVVATSEVKPTVLRWNSVPFVKYYMLEIKNERGRVLVKKRLTTTKYNFYTKNSGVYYYRLSLINRMGKMELQSAWKKVEVVTVRIPKVHSLSPSTLLLRNPYQLEMLGENFDSRNKLVALQVFKEKEKGVIKEHLGLPIPLKHSVESPEKITIEIPEKQFSTGNYKVSILFRDKPLYVSPHPLFSVEPKKFISRLYFMPSYYYINPSKSMGLQYVSLSMGYGMDIRWGTRLFKNKLEVGFAGGFYFFAPSKSGKRYIKLAGMVPFGGYIGYNGEVATKKATVHFMPYIDMGYDLYFFNYLEKYKEVITKNTIGVPKMNTGLMFMVEKKKLLFSMGIAASFVITTKKFMFSGIIVNLGLGFRIEFTPKKKGE